MRTLAAGNKHHRAPARGFTLMELLVVVALIAVATAGVSLSLRDSAHSALQRDAERLAVLLETGRAQARANGLPVVWRTQDNTPNAVQSFVFEGLPPPGLPLLALEFRAPWEFGAVLPAWPVTASRHSWRRRSSSNACAHRCRG